MLPCTAVLILLVARVARAGDGAPSDHLLYVPVPVGMSERDLSRADGPVRARLDALIAAQGRNLWTGPNRPDDAVVILTTPDGEPILPDLAAARRAAAAQTLTAKASGDLAFRFDSPIYPWSPAEVATLTAALNAFYPTAKAIYGPPAFANTVNVRRDPTIGFAAEYDVTRNEIILTNATSLSTLCHEMIHAFRDDDIIALSTFEEGMTRAAEIEVFDRLAPAYTHSFDQSHSYTYDVFYEALNRPAIGSFKGRVFAGYVSPLLRYQLAGYAWGKGLLESARFLADYNALLYGGILEDPATGHIESRLVAMAASVLPTIEGEPFDAWFAKQSVLNTEPPTGYQLYQRVNQFVADLFTRDGTTGIEVMQPSSPIQWALYDDRDALLGGGSGVTSANGFIDFSYEASGALAGYTGRVTVLATASTPDGLVTDTAVRAVGLTRGVFGVVRGGSQGTVTIASLDDPAAIATVEVAHGAFTAPTLAATRGRHTALFVDPNGRTMSRVFTKDASDYFVVLGPAPSTADLSATLQASRKTVKTGTTLSYTMTLHNHGPDAASEVIATITLPADAQIQAVSGSSACLVPTPGGVPTCFVESLAPGANLTATVVVGVTATARNVLRTTATVTATSTDPAHANDTAAVTVKVAGRL